jgi:DNA-binding LacI/PurR family transcriptional regulator
MVKATIYDVAKEAGVSIAAVSQVINGKGKISEKKRNEIFQVMERLSFKPSFIATALTGKKTYTLGLLIPDIANPFFAEIARAVEDQGRKLGYSLVICSTDNDDDQVERYLTLLEQKSVDGIIIGTGVETKKVLKAMLKLTVPVSVIARELPVPNIHTVVVDDYAGGASAARHLLGLGHTRMAVLAESVKVSSSRERIRGFREMMEEAGLRLPDNRIKRGEHLIEDGRQMTVRLMSAAHPPTAIFCCNDLLAIGALQGAKELGVRVPEDLSLVGFDNTILATVANPPLTTVAQPIESMGQTVVDLLVRDLNKETQDRQRVVLEPELIVRQSTAGPAR